MSGSEPRCITNGNLRSDLAGLSTAGLEARDRCHLFSLWTRSSWVLDTNVGSKLFVTLGFVQPPHFVQCSANEGSRRFKHPCTLGATETLEAVSFDPHRTARHRRSMMPNPRQYGTGSPDGSRGPSEEWLIGESSWLALSIVVGQSVGCNDNVNVSALFEPHIIAMFVR